MIQGGALSSYIIVIPGLSWAIAQLLKMIIRFFDPRFDNAYIMSSGGMPSVHACFMTSLTTAVALKEGLTSTIFVVTLCMSAIVMYDAMNIRYQGGEHARVINRLAKHFEETKLTKFNELLGHKPMEVLVGGCLGVLLGTLLYFV